MAAVQPSLLLPTLPTPRTRLFGRQAEVAAGRALLVDEAAPLMTLSGPGGVGKTRLALAIAAEVAELFADGVVCSRDGEQTDAPWEKNFAGGCWN